MRNLCIANFPTLTCLPHKRISLMQNSQLEKSREICGEYNCAILITTQLHPHFPDLSSNFSNLPSSPSSSLPSFLPFFFFFLSFFFSSLRITNDQLTLVLQNHECRINCHVFLSSSFSPSFFSPHFSRNSKSLIAHILERFRLDV